MGPRLLANIYILPIESCPVILSREAVDWWISLVARTYLRSTSRSRRTSSKPRVQMKKEGLMRKHAIRFVNGDEGTLVELDDGQFACPICGTAWDVPPYYPNDGVLGPAHCFSTPSMGDVCPGCHVEFGVDEGIGTAAPPGSQTLQWRFFRVQWLNRVGWNPAALQQLNQNLGISEEQARREADEMRE